MMRSARVAIVSAAFVVVLLPILALMVAWGYERWLMYRFEGALGALADEAIATGALHDIGLRGEVELFHLTADGSVRAHSSSHAEAARPSSFASATQRFRDLFGDFAPRDPWEHLETSAGALASRSEVHAALEGRRAFRTRESSTGDAVLFSFAAPHPDGGVVYVQTATVRGLRRLVYLRAELLKLSLYQLLAAGIFAALLGRWLVTPLERLSDGAARYPSSPLVTPELMRRQDEVGQLARAFDALTTNLEERRRATVDLAADMAHELKNPLATIAAAAELCGTSRDLTPQKRSLLEEQITSAVARLEHTCDELLAQVRLEATLPSMPREQLRYDDLLWSIISDYQADPRFKHVRFDVDVAPEVGEVSLVRSAWRRLVGNLLDNALVQPAQRPEVHVRAVREGSRIVTFVRDFGPGISPGNRDKIFRRFFTRRPEGVEAGTGLGLSIVEAVAKAHGGGVRLVDTQEGPGATFEVTFVS